MKSNKRKSKLIILFIVLGLTICGCISNGGVKTEKQIIGDINNSEYLSKYGLEVYDIEISRRKTDKNNKTDSMVTWIQSKNDIMAYSMGFELNYTGPMSLCITTGLTVFLLLFAVSRHFKTSSTSSVLLNVQAIIFLEYKFIILFRYTNPSSSVYI